MADDMSPSQVDAAATAAGDEAVADAGPTVNYDRLNEAVQAHQQSLARVRAIAAMQVRIASGASAYLTIDAGEASIDITAQAAALLGAALTAETANATSLGAILAAAVSDLPT